MKRILSLLLTSALILGLLSACGEGRDVATPAPQSRNCLPRLRL